MELDGGRAEAVAVLIAADEVQGIGFQVFHRFFGRDSIGAVFRAKAERAEEGHRAGEVIRIPQGHGIRALAAHGAAHRQAVAGIIDGAVLAVDQRDQLFGDHLFPFAGPPAVFAGIGNDHDHFIEQARLDTFVQQRVHMVGAVGGMVGIELVQQVHGGIIPPGGFVARWYS